jgi:exosome complex component RRP41
MRASSATFFPDLNYVEDSAGGPDLTVALLPKAEKVTLLQVSLLSLQVLASWYRLSSTGF